LALPHREPLGADPKDRNDAVLKLIQASNAPPAKTEGVDLELAIGMTAIDGVEVADAHEGAYDGLGKP